MPYKALKPIPKGDGSVFMAGEFVDAAKWRNLRTLLNGRYLMEVMDGPVAVAQEPVKARKVKSNVNL